jgi:hypothetical protein
MAQPRRQSISSREALIKSNAKNSTAEFADGRGQKMFFIFVRASHGCFATTFAKQMFAKQMFAKQTRCPWLMY